jgi:hypothetical protein
MLSPQRPALHGTAHGSPGDARAGFLPYRSPCRGDWLPPCSCSFLSSKARSTSVSPGRSGRSTSRSLKLRRPKSAVRCLARCRSFRRQLVESGHQPGAGRCALGAVHRLHQQRRNETAASRLRRVRRAGQCQHLWLSVRRGPGESAAAHGSVLLSRRNPARSSDTTSKSSSWDGADPVVARRPARRRRSASGRVARASRSRGRLPRTRRATSSTSNEIVVTI